MYDDGNGSVEGKFNNIYIKDDSSASLNWKEGTKLTMKMEELVLGAQRVHAV